MRNSLSKSTTYVMRLGRHHFAHLRSVAQGIDIQESAKRYLGVEHGHEAKTAHLQTREAIRSLARRSGDSAWRLIGMHIDVKTDGTKPTLEDFRAERDMDDWNESDVIDFYNDAYPEDRKSARRFLLQDRQLKLLYKIEGLSAEIPKPTDLISDWFDSNISKKIIGAGLITLGELNSKVSIGGRWYSGLAGVGVGKAERIEAHLSTLLEREKQPPKKFFPLVSKTEKPAPGRLLSTSVEGNGYPLTGMLDTVTGANLSFKLLEASGDDEAVDGWIKARAGSQLTATVYKREASRLLIWLQHEKGGKSFSQMSVNDCGDYMAFLQNIPERYISRERAAPRMPGWAPFRGQLSTKSHRQSIVIIVGLFSWLSSAQYLTGNPWVLINLNTGDDKEEKMLDTKALSEMAVKEIHAYIDAQTPSPSRSRIRFILRFVEAVGLRSAELLNATLGDLRLVPEGWVMQIHGKGAKNRVAVVPGQAFAALQEYLDMRGIGRIETAPPYAPLVASAMDPMERVGYQALYEHVRSWVSKAVNASNLPANERAQLAGASTHWLRHTFGTRAIARDVPLDVIQAQMGHASIQTTTAIYGRAPIKRRVDELGKAFG